MGLAIYGRKDGASHKQYTNSAGISLDGHDIVLFEKNLTNFRVEKKYGPNSISTGRQSNRNMDKNQCGALTESTAVP
jgi:hypothetical protein